MLLLVFNSRPDTINSLVLITRTTFISSMFVYVLRSLYLSVIYRESCTYEVLKYDIFSIHLTISSRASTESTIFYNSFILRVFTDWFMVISTQCGVTVVVERTLLSKHLNRKIHFSYKLFQPSLPNTRSSYRHANLQLVTATHIIHLYH